MSDLKSGHEIVVTMSRNSIFPWQKSPSFRAIYQHGPAGPGDTMCVRLADGSGTLVELNCNSSDFVAVHRAPAGTEWS